MKASDLDAYLRGLVADLPEPTVDRVIFGDPDAEIRAIAVAWMPYRETIEQAAALGSNVLVVHEPTFYDHWDLDGKLAALPACEAKRALIAAHGLTIIRCHDVWDAMPGAGIPYAWGRHLGLGEPMKAVRYYNLYTVPAQTALEFAHRVAARTRPLGQPAVGFYGEAGRIVRTVGLGTGCISDPRTLYGLGADLAISVDDVVRSWIAGALSHDTGNPLVVVNHGVSEEPGMVTLAAHLAGAFPQIQVTHIRQGCSFRAVRPRTHNRKATNHGPSSVTP